jgi:hypothetical protein
MFCSLFVGDIRSLAPWHMADGTILLLGMVVRRNRVPGVATETLATVVAHPSCRTWRSMGIMACSTGQLIAARYFAAAAQQCFVLTGCTNGALVAVRFHEVSNMVGYIVPGTKRSERGLGPVYRRLTFEVAL